MDTTDDVLDAVGPRLRALRQEHDLTLAELSVSTGISVSTLSRLESGDVPMNREPVALRPLVDRVVAEVAVGRPDRRLEVRNLIEASLPPVNADRERLHQVLFNLLDNAFRFTPSGEQVTIQAARHPEGCEVTVEDTGPGIPEEHRPLVFERFYRVDPSRSRGDGGTGIGLAIARSVVQAHGGRIWAENADGHGARFRFVLPLAERPKESRPLPESSVTTGRS